MRATRKRVAAIIETMRDDDSINMLQAAQKNGVPGEIAAEWYQMGKEFSASEVSKEFYRAIYRLLMDRDHTEMMRQFEASVIAQAKAGDKQLQRILKRKGIDYLK